MHYKRPWLAVSGVWQLRVAGFGAEVWFGRRLEGHDGVCYGV